MPFSLQLVSEEPDRLIWHFCDGDLILLQLDRCRMGEQQYTALTWYGAVLAPRMLHQHYRALATACRGLDPQHSSVWDFRLRSRIWFESRTSPAPESVTTGRDELDLYHTGPAAAKEIAAQLYRRRSDWANASFHSHDDQMCLSGTSNTERCRSELLFRLSDPPPISTLPINTLADCIKGTHPVATRAVKSGEKARDGGDRYEIRYEPWPLQRRELLTVLKEIEEVWYTPFGAKKAA